METGVWMRLGGARAGQNLLSSGHGWGHGLGHARLKPPAGATMRWMTSASERVTISGPGLNGSYEVVERRSDGSLLLRPEPELLSEVLRETDGAVFRDEEFIAHLERVMATEDDLPGEHSD